MRLGLIISTFLHVGLLGWVVWSVANTRPKDIEPVKRVTVELVKASEMTKIRQGVAKPKKVEKDKKPTPPVKKAKPKVKPAIKKVAVLPPKRKPEPPKKKPAKPEPQPVKSKPVEVKKPEPPKRPKPKKLAEIPKAKPKPVVKKPAVPKRKVAKAEPKPQAKPVRKPKAKPARKPEIRPRPVPPRETARKPDPRFDPNNIAALLNRLPNASPEPQPRVERYARRSESPEPPRQQRGQRDGRDTELSATERDRLLSSIVRQVEGCWSPPTGVREARNLVPRVKFSLRRDGSLAGAPEVMNTAGSPLFTAASTAATRAIYECQPYRLPPELYDSWSEVILRFDPKEMLGG